MAKCGSLFKKVRAWLRGPSVALCTAYLLSCLVYRVWDFALGLSLVLLEDSTLRLVAIYGLSSSGLQLVAGGWIGCWVDKNPRIKVVRLPMLIHTICIVISSLSVSGLLVYRERLGEDWTHSPAFTLFKVAVIFIAILAKLSISAFKIALCKDWVVVVTDGNARELAKLNAVTQASDLVLMTASPIAGLYLLTAVSKMLASIIISTSAVVFGLVEYGLLIWVYHLKPQLNVKEEKSKDQGKKSSARKSSTSQLERLPNTDSQIQGQQACPKHLPGSQPKPVKRPPIIRYHQASPLANSQRRVEIILQNQDIFSKTLSNINLQNRQHDDTAAPVNKTKMKSTRRKKCLTFVLTPLISFAHGWGVYARQSVFMVGLGIATLQMSVLNFDSLTVGYIYAQDVEEVSLSLCFGAAALLGLVGIFLYTKLQSHIGLHYTGLCAFTLQVIFISIALVSVWMPGSPFLKQDLVLDNTTNFSDIQSLSELTNMSSSLSRNSSMSHYQIHTLPRNDFKHVNGMESKLLSGAEVLDPFLKHEGLLRPFVQNCTDGIGQDVLCGHHSSKHTNGSQPQPLPKTSVYMFLAAVVLSHIGFWMADLTVVHLYQHQVAAAERGVVGGVQASLYKLLLMVNFGVVVILPHVHTFGYLIMWSFGWVLLGTALFVVYVIRARLNPQMLHNGV